MDTPAFYEIRIKGHLDASRADWFDGLSITNLEGGQALLSGYLPDQAALHGVLDRIGGLGMPLISVNPVPDRSLPGG